MTERTNEQQLDLFADLLGPVAEIFGDQEMAKVYREGNKVKATQFAIRNHKSAIIEILARLDGCEPSDYQVPGPMGLMLKVVAFLNNTDVADLFTSQGQKSAANASGSATVNTEENGVE